MGGSNTVNADVGWVKKKGLGSWGVLSAAQLADACEAVGTDVGSSGVGVFDGRRGVHFSMLSVTFRNASGLGRSLKLHRNSHIGFRVTKAVST